MRIRVNFERPAEVCYIGHIDLTRAVTRGLRRTGLPLKFTEGFNQRVKTEMGFPLSVGIIGEDEYFDFYLSENTPEDVILQSLEGAFKNILVIKRIKSVSYSAPSLTSMNAILTHFLYGILLSDIPEDKIEYVLSNIMQKREIIINRSRKNIVKTKDVRPFIKELKLLSIDGSNVTFLLPIYFTQKGSIKMDEAKNLIKQSGIDVDFTYAVRKRTMVVYKGKIISPMDF